VPVGGLFKLSPFCQALQLLGGDIFKVTFVPGEITKFIREDSFIILCKGVSSLIVGDLWKA
jgi:hypothetical protein